MHVDLRFVGHELNAKVWFTRFNWWTYIRSIFALGYLNSLLRERDIFRGELEVSWITLWKDFPYSFKREVTMNTFLIEVPGRLPGVRWDETSQSTNANKASPDPRQSKQQPQFPSSPSDLACLTFLLSINHHMPVALSLLAMCGLLPHNNSFLFYRGVGNSKLPGMSQGPSPPAHKQVPQTREDESRGMGGGLGGRTAVGRGEGKWGAELGRWKTGRWREEDEGFVESLGLGEYASGLLGGMWNP